MNPGLPQMLVLGTSLRLDYINDVAENIAVGITLFGDDCVAFNEVKSVDGQGLLSDNLEALLVWCTRWQVVKVDVEKTVPLTISHKKFAVLFHHKIGNETQCKVNSANVSASFPRNSTS